MRLNEVIKFQKTLALAASASNQFEAEAAELAARRIVEVCSLDLMRVPVVSLYNHLNFSDNALLKKLREEYREAHPLPEPVAREAKDALADLDHIPFNISGFSKHANRKKGVARAPAAQLTHADYEAVRILLNEGLELKTIAERTGLRATTINSTRAYHVRKNKWVRDQNNHFQWATQEDAARAGGLADAMPCASLGPEDGCT